MADKVINMIMLGPSRVGKSSLLATMSREIAKMKTGFTVTPTGDTEDRLDEAFQQLSQVMDQPVFAAAEDLLKGTLEFIEHRFKVGFKGTKEFDLVFHDFRGGAMTTNGEDHKLLREKVAGSHVIFNVLDSVALMEVDAVEGDKRNGHSRAYNLLSDTLKRGEKYLIIFVLVKCETYVKTANGRDLLHKRFEERHQAVLQLIDKLNEGNKRNVAALVVPAVTLGCVEFKEVEQDGTFTFVRIHKDFAPRDVDQPLRYALAFALQHVNENRWFLDWLVRLLTGHGRTFGHALKDFYNQRNGDYKKYGNKALLEVK